MQSSVQRQLDMARRVRAFSWAHPWSNTSYIAATDRLDERIRRAESLTRQMSSLYDGDAGSRALDEACAELESVNAEIVGLMLQIDALTRFHFRTDAEVLAVWKTVRHTPHPEEASIQPAA